MLNKYFLFSICLIIFNYIQSQSDSVNLNSILFNKDEFNKVLHSNSDSLKMKSIEVLLGYKGDTVVNDNWEFYPNYSNYLEYIGKISTECGLFNYGSNQFVALYLISALYFNDLEFCERIEIVFEENDTLVYTTNIDGSYVYIESPLRNKRKYRNKHCTIKYRTHRNDIYDRIYAYYEEWFIKYKVNRNTPAPLYDVPNIYWYGEKSW